VSITKKKGSLRGISPLRFILVKTRQTDTLIRLYLTWESDDLQEAFERIVTAEFKDYNDFVKKYGPITSPERPPVHRALSRVSFFFHGVGILVHRKLADIGLVDALIGYGVIWLWEKMKPLVEGWRKDLNMPKSVWGFEYLYDEMKKREQQVAKIQ